MNWEEACRIIGVAPTASEQEIHEQYLYKVQILHPDGNSNKPLAVRKRAEEELKQVNEALNVLKDSTNNPFSNSPRLDISSRKIRFREINLGQKKSASFEVKNVGGTYSKIWIDDSPAPWLRVTDIKSLTSELLPLKVTIEATGIGEPNKHYACSLAVSLENEQTKVKDEAIVRVELWMKAEPGTLRLEARNAIRFSLRPGTPKSRSFELSNTGHGLLQGHLSTTRPWLLVSPASVNIAPSKRTTYTVTLASGAPQGGFADKTFINIITNGGNDRVPVELSAAAYFSLRKLYGAFLYLITGCLLALTPFVLALFHRSANYWDEPLTWVAVSVDLALIGGFVFSPRFRKRGQKRKTRD